MDAASQLAAKSPTTAAKSLIAFRSTVLETASYVRDIVGQQDDFTDLEDVVAQVGDGLDALEKEVAANRESSASVLAVDSRSRQGSIIRIRTQEGDIVSLRLMQMDSLSAMDVSNSDGSSTFTEVGISSQSRLMLRVEGDLNAGELEAITNVFAQAEGIANEFFGGDIGAAFNLAEGFEFDADQLARVKLGFRMSHLTNVSYTESTGTTPEVTDPVPVAAEPESTAIATVTDESALVSEDISATDESALVSEDISATDDVVVADEPVVADSVAESTPDAIAMSGFLESLSAFLRSFSEGFTDASSSGGFKYYYSESFKLELLSVVFNAVAPDDAEVAASGATTIIDGIAEDVTEQVV